jgi:hypothetical protein
VAALVADLESVDAVEDEVRPLRDLVTELAHVLTPAGPGQVRLERLRERALAVLRAFAAPGLLGPGPDRARVPGQPPVPGHPQVPGHPSAPVRPEPVRDPQFWRR